MPYSDDSIADRATAAGYSSKLDILALEENLDEDSDDFLSFYDILQAANGTDKENHTKVSVSVNLFTLSNDGQTVIDAQTSDLGGAPVYFSVYNGALVMEAVIPSNSLEGLEETNSILETWTPKQSDPSYRQNHILHVILTPLDFRGVIMVDLKELFYYVLFRVPSDNTWHLVAVFAIDDEDGSIEIIEDPDADFDQLMRDAEFELEGEISDIEEEYDHVSEEIEALRKKQNETASFVQREIQDVDLDEEYDDDEYEDDDYEESPWMRSSAMEIERSKIDRPWMRISKDDQDD